MSIKERKKKN